MALKSVSVRATHASPSALQIHNVRGQSLEVALSPSAPGFSPLELQASALAACVAMSVRIAARQAGQPLLGRVDVAVTATKAADEPSRLGSFDVVVEIVDELPLSVSAALVAAAEDICTISNTLRSLDVRISSRTA